LMAHNPARSITIRGRASFFVELTFPLCNACAVGVVASPSMAKQQASGLQTAPQ
jgi:hypothetical protein